MFQLFNLLSRYLYYTTFLNSLSSSDKWNERFNESMKSTLQNVALKSLVSLFFCCFLCFTLNLTKNTHQHQAFRHFLFEWIIFFLFLILNMWLKPSWIQQCKVDELFLPILREFIITTVL